MSFTETVHADWGERAVRITCEAQQDTVILEPFIIWNDEYRHNGVDISALKTSSNVTIGSSTYYLVHKPNIQSFTSICETPTRSVMFKLERRKIIIEERGVNFTDRGKIDLDKDISFAWDIWGPVYILKSSGVQTWQSCAGRQDVAAVSCKSFKLQ